MTTPPPWSYSSLDCFAKCPRQYYHRYILKEKQPETEAQRLGNELDKAMEARLQVATPLPPHFAQHEAFAASLYNKRGSGVKLSTQLKLGLDRQFKAVPFFDPAVWGRGVLDALLYNPDEAWATIIDWKTGKNSEKKSYSNGGLQLKIFAAMTFKHFPKVQKITAFNIWLNDGGIGAPLVFTREQERGLWMEILPLVLRVEKACLEDKWPEMPSGLCGWCPVKACLHNRS